MQIMYQHWQLIFCSQSKKKEKHFWIRPWLKNDQRNYVLFKSRICYTNDSFSLAKQKHLKVYLSFKFIRNKTIFHISTYFIVERLSISTTNSSEITPEEALKSGQFGDSNSPAVINRIFIFFFSTSNTFLSIVLPLFIASLI